MRLRDWYAPDEEYEAQRPPTRGELAAMLMRFRRVRARALLKLEPTILMMKALEDEMSRHPPGSPRRVYLQDKQERIYLPVRPRILALHRYEARIRQLERTLLKRR